MSASEHGFAFGEPEPPFWTACTQPERPPDEFTMWHVAVFDGQTVCPGCLIKSQAGSTDPNVRVPNYETRRDTPSAHPYIEAQKDRAPRRGRA